jgi:hypothetical protein
MSLIEKLFSGYFDHLWGRTMATAAMQGKLNGSEVAAMDYLCAQVYPEMKSRFPDFTRADLIYLVNRANSRGR